MALGSRLILTSSHSRVPHGDFPSGHCVPKGLTVQQLGPGTREDPYIWVYLGAHRSARAKHNWETLFFTPGMILNPCVPLAQRRLHFPQQPSEQFVGEMAKGAVAKKAAKAHTDGNMLGTIGTQLSPLNSQEMTRTKWA